MIVVQSDSNRRRMSKSLGSPQIEQEDISEQNADSPLLSSNSYINQDEVSERKIWKYIRVMIRERQVLVKQVEKLIE